ncbi:hypothetical protein GQ43DRAFT_409211 [Delitschia confertaspora ATCC 74209]|uniref:DUF3533 domain-containing protein n=1 Tax=Delitschia confertaspora ATCC 74209 TaxID=1513339 RepID=A0A9P4JSX3_9PLEO|nr:hypothetical protein GQ43DRAFT_409211 [Delitschia confertaspora ATCC 74209]
MSATLGCQIAPNYDHVDTSSSSSISSIDDDHQIISTSGYPDHGEIEKVETVRENVRPAVLQQGRTRSSKRGQALPQSPVGFWHWEMSGVRLHVVKLWLQTNLILAIAIMCFLSLFWGALYNQDKLAFKLGVWVVDFDGQVAPYEDGEPLVGPLVKRVVTDFILEAGGTHPGYTIRSPADFDNDPLKVRKGVYDFDAWAAVIINPNATALLRNAITERNTSYDPLGACQVVYNSARDQSLSSTYLIPSLLKLQKAAITQFGRKWIPSLLQNASITGQDLLVVPQAVSPGIEFTMYDLRPFGPPIATPTISIGLIYLIIISFFSFTFFLPIHLKYLSPKGHPPLRFPHLIIWRYFATVVSYFFLSLVYSLVSVAFLMPMSNQPASHFWPAKNPNAYGHGTFPVYWMINFTGMTAFGLASENMAMLLGTPWTALWLIFWVISNVATGFYALPLASSFYRWGYAWPMHNIVEATRSTLFDLHPRIGLNFGIILTWCAVDTILFPFCCYFMRWRSAREKRLAAQKEAAWQAKMDREKEEPGIFSRVTTLSGRPTRNFPR